MPGNPVLEQHRAAGGLCYEEVDGQLTETEGESRRPLVALAELPGSFGGRARHVVANALAAAAACRAMGVTAKDIRRGLATFTPADANPGRGNIYRAGPGPVIMDYGHNAAALAAAGQFVTEVWGGDPVAAVTLPGDRRDDLVAAAAEAIATWFGKVVLYEDSDKRGRGTGEMLSLVSRALRQARPGIRCELAANPADALRTAVELAAGEPVLFVYEKLALARDALAVVGAEPWPEAEVLQPSDTSEHMASAEPGDATAPAAEAAVVHEAAAVVASAAAAVRADGGAEAGPHACPDARADAGPDARPDASADYAH
jgi:cyanophycin synthetase